MKPHSYPPRRIVVRLKPGRIVRLPPCLLKYAGWRPGDVLLVRIEERCVIWTRLPDEWTWRIDRLRRRIGSTTDGHSASQWIRTFGDYLALRRDDSGQMSAGVGEIVTTGAAVAFPRTVRLGNRLSRS